MADTDVLTLPVLPLSAGVVGPGMVVTLAVETPSAIAAADAAQHNGGQLLLVPRTGPAYARIGVIAKVENDGGLPGGRRGLVVRGLTRARLGAGASGPGNALHVEAERVEDGPVTAEALELAREYRAVIEAILERRGAHQIAEAVASVSDPSSVADMALYSPDLSFEQKVEVLEALDLEDRLRKVLSWAKDTLAELSVADDVRRSVHEGIDKEQREALLRRQLQAIREELGDTAGGDASDLRARLDALVERGAPQGVVAAVERELDKLERMSPQSPEHGWVTSWLETVFDLPWGVRVPEQLDLASARQVLDEDHTGLDTVKDRILEHLAVRKLRAERSVSSPADGSAGGGRPDAAIIALVGPPGVGKTSLGQSVARALGRPFARVALGGVRDEAEIRGHRRTYVGARPGRLVRALTDAGAMNPVLLLDEVDKLGGDWRGDPSAALLEVLDPAQNHTFRDHYLEIELDLSEVVFLATANSLETIPAPLLDRVELIPLDGYSEQEKTAIARDHLLPRLIERTGLTPDEVQVTDEALAEIAARYTREAGVRELERQLAKALRKLAVGIAGGGSGAATVIDPEKARELLGRPRFEHEVAERTAMAGVATGLAVTGAGGDVLFIEAAAMDGEPGLTITGQLGDVMRESAEIARSYVRSHKAELGLADAEVDARRLHLHVPAGAVPKDGPSAGVTMTTALVSLFSGRPVKHTVGMTGEVTLQGKVLPIGGVKQKVLAAHRAGLTEVILPARNGPDVDDVPEEVRAQLTIHLASDVREVIEWALEPA
ncbi:MAG: endopeptidase La [Acidimicrobiales bacterium]